MKIARYGFWYQPLNCVSFLINRIGECDLQSFIMLSWDFWGSTLLEVPAQPSHQPSKSSENYAKSFLQNSQTLFYKLPKPSKTLQEQWIMGSIMAVFVCESPSRRPPLRAWHNWRTQGGRGSGTWYDLMIPQGEAPSDLWLWHARNDGYETDQGKIYGLRREATGNPPYQCGHGFFRISSNRKFMTWDPFSIECLRSEEYPDCRTGSQRASNWLMLYFMRIYTPCWLFSVLSICYVLF